MIFKEERKNNLTELFAKVDFKLITHTLKTSDEKVLIKCNKCSKEYNSDFHFLFSKLKRQILCSCHQNNVPNDINEYNLANFQTYFDSINKLEKNKKKELEDFLTKEQEEVAKFIFSNRGVKSYTQDLKDYIVKCNCDHIFVVKFSELTTGKKWCECGINGKGE